jgi:hypothetical protein
MGKELKGFSPDKSPCRDCERINESPGCRENCVILGKWTDALLIMIEGREEAPSTGICPILHHHRVLMSDRSKFPCS